MVDDAGYPKATLVSTSQFRGERPRKVAIINGPHANRIWFAAERNYVQPRATFPRSSQPASRKQFTAGVLAMKRVTPHASSQTVAQVRGEGPKKVAPESVPAFFGPLPPEFKL